jgi:hypothetical protein
LVRKLAGIVEGRVKALDALDIKPPNYGVPE